MAVLKTRQEILSDPEFVELTRQKNSISLVLTLVELGLYFGFILLVAFGQSVLARMLTPRVPLGIPIAVGTIIISWVLTGIYTRWANNSYDPMVRNVKSKIGG
jgi:uncharacterized membrane protein (DUF485 family)